MRLASPDPPSVTRSQVRLRIAIRASVADFLDQFDASTQTAERERAAQRERSARAELRKPCSWWRIWSILLEDSAPATSGLVLAYALPSAVSAAHISSPFHQAGRARGPRSARERDGGR